MDEDADYTVFEIDHSYKRKLARPHISVARYVTTEFNKKLFFGSPNPLLLIEDLVYSLSLEDLR